MKKLVILGCTGSIGTQALEIVAASDELQVVGLAAGSSWELALAQASSTASRPSRSPTRARPSGRATPGAARCSRARRGSAS